MQFDPFVGGSMILFPQISPLIIFKINYYETIGPRYTYIVGKYEIYIIRNLDTGRKVSVYSYRFLVSIYMNEVPTFFY